MGINLSRVTAFSFAAGAAVAGWRPARLAEHFGALPDGRATRDPGLHRARHRGVGRVEGALIGGLLLAFAEQLTIRYAPIPSGFAQGVPLLFLMIFLIVRPTGLLRARA